jgi:hypothetical protein
LYQHNDNVTLIRPDIPVIRMDCNIHDEEFAARCENVLLEHLANKTRG